MTFSAEPAGLHRDARPQVSSSDAMPFGLPFCTANTTNSRTQSTKSLLLAVGEVADGAQVAVVAPGLDAGHPSLGGRRR